jgi:hypothetical protein
MYGLGYITELYWYPYDLDQYPREEFARPVLDFVILRSCYDLYIEYKRYFSLGGKDYTDGYEIFEHDKDQELNYIQKYDLVKKET